MVYHVERYTVLYKLITASKKEYLGFQIIITNTRGGPLERIDFTNPVAL